MVCLNGEKMKGQNIQFFFKKLFGNNYERSKSQCQKNPAEIQTLF